MKRLLHWIAHLFGWNTGKAEVFWQDKRLFVGFRCEGCGELSHVYESYTTKSRSDSR